MNDKFFQLPVEKQNRIINAAYKVFSESSYKKAPMSEIANAGNISKALLFHYFENKKELYMYLWNNAIEQTRKSISDYHVTETSDFFEMIRRSLLAKCALMRSYPYLYLFSLKAYYEQEQDVRASIQSSFKSASNHSEEIIWDTVDLSEFRQDIDIKLIYQEILWASDGYLQQMMSSNVLSPDQMEKDLLRMIEQWKKVYLK